MNGEKSHPDPSHLTPPLVPAAALGVLSGTAWVQLRAGGQLPACVIMKVSFYSEILSIWDTTLLLKPQQC